MEAGQQLVGDDAERIHVVRGMRIDAVDHLVGRIRLGVRAEAARIEHVAARFAYCMLGTARAMPKSRIFGVPSSVMKTLPGFRSECTMPLRCAYARPSAMPRMIGSATSRLMPLPRASRAIESSVRPLQQLHRHVDRVAVAIEVEHRDDVRMRERLRLARFALQRHERLADDAGNPRSAP